MGRGRVVYFPFDLDRTFWEVLSNDHGLLLKNAVAWAHNEEQPLAVEGQGVLDVSLWMQKDSMTAHLVNLTNPMMMKGPLREILPSPPQRVRIRVPQERRVRRVSLLVSGKPPVYRMAGNVVTARDPFDRTPRSDRSGSGMKSALLMATVLIASASAEEGWWMREPIRWVQTNLRQTDAGLDAARLVEQLADMRANVLLMGMGGIAAYYPTAVRVSLPEPATCRRAATCSAMSCARRTRARSGSSAASISARRRRPCSTLTRNGSSARRTASPVIYNGLYSTCINGGYYRVQAMKILAEALEKYDVDGLFFNMFGNQSRDYSGRPVGLCHCDACQRLVSRAVPQRDSRQRRTTTTASSCSARRGRWLRRSAS